MGALDHWNPVFLSRDLKKKPEAIRIDGRDLVLFRTSDRTVGALDDTCLHRRMRLSCGSVAGDRVVCPYHGWTFGKCGDGESPGTPKMRAQAVAYDVREAYGVVWLKTAGVEAEFPDIKPDGYYQLCASKFVAEAPLELALDNFSELEHSASTHILFGYDLVRLPEMTMTVRADDRHTYVVTTGPHKKMHWLPKLLMGLKTDGEFTSDWKTSFSPVYSIFDHTIVDTDTRKPAKVNWRLCVFFTPIDAMNTRLSVIVFTKSSYPGPNGCIRPVSPILTRMFESEINLDLEILKNIADKNPKLTGMKLGRYDRVLALNRERINRVYRGLDTPVTNGESPDLSPPDNAPTIAAPVPTSLVSEPVEAKFNGSKVAAASSSSV
jgi:nitrite reductase/ring-hydroxylating ferredoxin subunit